MSSKARAPPSKLAGAPSTKGAPTLTRPTPFPRGYRPPPLHTAAPGLPSWFYYAKIFAVATALTSAAAGALYAFNDMKLKQLAEHEEQMKSETTELAHVPSVHRSNTLLSAEDLETTASRRKGWLSLWSTSKSPSDSTQTGNVTAALQEKQGAYPPMPVDAQTSENQDKGSKSGKSWLPWRN